MGIRIENIVPQPSVDDALYQNEDILSKIKKDVSKWGDNYNEGELHDLVFQNYGRDGYRLWADSLIEYDPSTKDYIDRLGYYNK